MNPTSDGFSSAQHILDGGTTVITVEGELDLAAAAGFKSALLAAAVSGQSR